MNKIKIFSRNKKGQLGLNALASAAVGVGVFIIVTAIVAVVLAQIADVQGQTGCTAFWNSSAQRCQPSAGNTTGSGNLTTAYNITSAGLAGLSLFGSFTSIVVIVAIAAVILALLAVAFAAFTR